MLKQKLKSPSFWTAVAGVLLMLAQIFGLRINLPAVNEILAIFGASLVCCGCLLPVKNSDNGSTPPTPPAPIPEI